jgi:phage terminase large subunit
MSDQQQLVDPVFDLDEEAARAELYRRLVREAVGTPELALSELAVIQVELLKRSRSAMLQRDVPPILRPLFSRARYKGAHGGRGSAKSWTFGLLALERSVTRKGQRIVCVREVQKSLEQSVKRLIEDLIQRFELGSLFRVLNTHIETPGDGVIIFQGMQNHTAESIKSLEGFDIAWVEEAQTLSQTSLDLLRPTIRKEGSEIWFSWNPRFPTDPVDALLRTGEPPPDSVVIEATFQDNPNFPDVLRQEMEYDRRRDPDKYNHIWLGGYQKSSEARVFRNWRVEEFETPEDAMFLFGSDFGFANDPDILVRGYIDSADPQKGGLLYIDHEVFKIGCELDDTPRLFDGLVCGCDYTRPDEPCKAPEKHGFARNWQIVGDSARPETISYLQRHGYQKFEPAKKGPGSIEEGIKFLKMYDIIVHPRCTHAIDEFTNYSYKVHPQTGEITNVLQDKKNNVIDSLRYMVEPVRNPKVTWVTW